MLRAYNLPLKVVSKEKLSPFPTYFLIISIINLPA